VNAPTVRLPDLGPYRPLRPLGEGGVGSVYLARFPDSPRRVAIKLLHPEVARDETAVKRFLDVARALAGEENQHVAAVLGARRLAADKVLVVMEYVDGQDLGDVLADNGPLDPERVRLIALQICQGLCAAHDRGVLHLDLKPENVFLLEDDPGRDLIKILDFGIAHLRASPGGSPPPRDHAGQLLGTPEYWSPEQASGGPVDARSDIYSLGVLLYELLSGATPFASHSVSDVVAHHMRTEPGPITRATDLPPVPAAFEELVLRCLAKDRARRYATAAELRRALADLDLNPPSAEEEETQAADVRPAAAERDPLVGTRLEKYKVTALLGEGGMGKVYEAEHTMLGRRVAIKMLRREYSTNQGAVQRFFTEARAVNRIAHPNIVEITDFFQEDEGDNYYIMELLEGISLDREIDREKGLAPKRMVHIGKQVCDALGVAHEAGIIHRDLKPENVYLTRRGDERDVVKLLDFGVAKLLDRHGESVQTTKAGAILGTPEYMAPEQAAAKPVDARTDIYALGAILYEMATGRPPFRSKGIAELLVMHLTVPPTSPHELDDLRYPIWPSLERVILRCLAKDPDERFQTMTELKKALGEALELGPSRTLETMAISLPTGEPKGRGRLVPALAAVALLVLGGGTAYGLFGEQIRGVLASGSSTEGGPDTAAPTAVPPAATPAPAPGGAAALGPTPPGDEPQPDPASGQDTPAEPAAIPSPAANETPARKAKKVATAPLRPPSAARSRKRQSRIRLAFSSLPEGAAVYRGGDREPLGRTPFSTSFQHSKQSETFFFRKPGYNAVRRVISLKRNGQVHAVLKSGKKKAAAGTDRTAKSRKGPGSDEPVWAKGQEQPPDKKAAEAKGKTKGKAKGKTKGKGKGKGKKKNTGRKKTADPF